MPEIIFAITSGAGGNQGLVTIGYIVFIVAMFWLLLIRPQKKQKKERAEMMDSLNVGDDIYTAGGILGTVTRIKERTVWVRISEKCEIELIKTSIGGKYTFQDVPEPKVSDSQVEEPKESKE